jgi:hypothetical protein
LRFLEIAPEIYEIALEPALCSPPEIDEIVPEPVLRFLEIASEIVPAAYERETFPNLSYTVYLSPPAIFVESQSMDRELLLMASLNLLNTDLLPHGTLFCDLRLIDNGIDKNIFSHSQHKLDTYASKTKNVLSYHFHGTSNKY